MRYDDLRRLRGVEDVWFRLKLWWKPVTLYLQTPPVSNFSHLSDHERRDIGLPEQVRYANWHELKERGGLS